MATRTFSLAQASIQPKVDHNGVIIRRSWSAGSLSATGAWLAKIPYGAKNVALGWDAIHTVETGAKLQFGYRNIDGSVTKSAVVAKTDIAVTNRTAWQMAAAVADPVWSETDDGANLQYKYLTVDRASGTIASGFVLNFELSYEF